MISVPAHFSIFKSRISFKCFAKAPTTENAHPLLYTLLGFEQRQDNLFMEFTGKASCSNCAQSWIVRKKNRTIFLSFQKSTASGKL